MFYQKYLLYTFRKYFLFLFMCVSEVIGIMCLQRPEGTKSSLNGVIEYHEVPCIVAGNQICVLYKNSKWSLLMNHLSIPLKCTFYVHFNHFVDFYKSNDNVLHLSRELYVTYRGIIFFPIQ